MAPMGQSSTLALLLLVSFALVGLVSSFPRFHQCCHCLPHQPCFPTARDWEDLNIAVANRLIKVSPAASPCHDPTYDASACADARGNWSDALWRSEQVGATQHPQWDGYCQENCLINANETTTCSQGSVPVYAIHVLDPSDVSNAFAFAFKHNIRVIVKNTGHDYLGRSTGRGSLSIWTHNLKNLYWHDSFVESGCPADNSTTSAVTVGAGVQWGELYKRAAAENKIVIGAFSKTVGAAGGYVQGGGHSTLSPTYGFAADNALQFEVVTPDGLYRIANRCQNKDLFWALRGGGGGTFGVVLSVTYKTYDAPNHILRAVISVTASNASSLTDFFDEYAKLQPSLGEKKWGGTFSSYPLGLRINYAQLDGDVETAKQDWEPLVSLGQTHPGLQVNPLFFPVPRYYDYFNATLCTIFPGHCTDQTGTNEILATRLVPRTVLSSSSSEVAKAIVNVLTRNSNGTRKFVLGLAVGGGEGSIPRDNALNPAWREAGWHVITQAVWADGASEEEKKVMFDDITDAIQPLRSLTPGSGAYFNEADYNEPDWQTSFFGNHYARLFAIKRAVDPFHLLACHHCVGSEPWNEDFTCRNDC